MKLKRKPIAAKYAALIEELYGLDAVDPALDAARRCARRIADLVRRGVSS